MLEALSYEDKVVHTFRKTALRTVLMIDDQFPTFSNLAGAGDLAAVREKFKEQPRALRLYDMFRQHDMPCDIENEITDIETINGVERIRKSDLVILDYNLDGSFDDNRKSVGLILRLAETSHFNTVVLYTNDPRLDQVWLDVAFSLKGGWKSPDKLLSGDPQNTWERLADNGITLPEISTELVKRYLVDGLKGLGEEQAVIAAELTSLNIDTSEHTALIEALIHLAVRERLADKTSTCGTTPRTLNGRCEADKPKWLQAGNCFIAIMGKTKLGTDGKPVDNDDIIGYLDSALKDWRPNLLQIVISEIQNILELEPLATDEMHLLNPEIQVGLFYYLLQRIGGVPPTDDGALFIPGIESIVDKLIENIRRKISANGMISSDAARLLRQELQGEDWPRAAVDDRTTFDLASRIAGVGVIPEPIDTIFKLNCFLNTEKFKRGHITTGSIVRTLGGEDYWICLSPACDMEDREPSNNQIWAKELFPVRAFVIVRLERIDGEVKEHKKAHKRAFEKATDGYTAFVENADGRHVFSLFRGGAAQPSYEFLFPANAGKVDLDHALTYPRFKAFRLGRPVSTEPVEHRTMMEVDFEVIGQMREQYASRFLQVIGQHLSRIGVDYVNLPKV